MKHTPFIFTAVLTCVSLLFSCKKEETGKIEPAPSPPGQDLKFYTNGTLRDADSLVVSHIGNMIVIDYFSSNTPPFLFTGSLTIPDTVAEGSNYTFGQGGELLFRNSESPSGHYFKSASGSYSITDHDLSTKRIEITFFGTLKGYNSNSQQTGQNLSISNGHAVGFYDE